MAMWCALLGHFRFRVYCFIYRHIMVSYISAVAVYTVHGLLQLAMCVALTTTKFVVFLWTNWNEKICCRRRSRQNWLDLMKYTLYTQCTLTPVRWAKPNSYRGLLFCFTLHACASPVEFILSFFLFFVVIYRHIVHGLHASHSILICAENNN